MFYPGENLSSARNLKISAVLISVVILAGIFMFSSCSAAKSSGGKQHYDFTTVSKGSIESTVASTGTLAVVSSVDVLAEMSGRIEAVYVDYNSRVKKGQVLAKINTDLLKIQEREARAEVDKYQITYDLQLLNVKNDKPLYDKKYLSEYDYKSELATLNIDKANLESAQASLEEITTEINQYAFITSPIDGIVLERDIDPGASVTGGSVSSSTTLFTIAGNLEEMEIKAEVDELDISSIKAGQEVKFTVEADPGENFEGTVKEVRLVPETSDNLVYYYVIILVDNKSGRLLPGMTANVNFIKEKKDDVFTVPNAALRFTPTTLSDAEKNRLLFEAGLPAEMSKADKSAAMARYDETLRNKSSRNSRKSSETGKMQQSGLSGLLNGGGGPGAGGPPQGGPGGGPGGGSVKHQPAGNSSKTESVRTVQPAARKPLWYLDKNGKLAVALVQVGISDLTRTEVSGADELAGKEIILKIKVE